MCVGGWWGCRGWGEEGVSCSGGLYTPAILPEIQVLSLFLCEIKMFGVALCGLGWTS